MSSLISIGLGLAIFYLIVLPVLAFMALSRIRALRYEVRSLRERLGQTTPAQDIPALSDAIELESMQQPVAAVAPTPDHRPAVPVRPVLTQAQATPSLAATLVEDASAHTADTLAQTTAHDAGPTSGIIGWFVRGNPLAKLGVLLLFFGLTYLFKYSIEHAQISIEMRLIGAGVLSLAMLAIGWRLRDKLPLYALILQGGAVGALYLTCFAASRLYNLLPMQSAFTVMLVICVASVTLAILQNAQSLAVVAALGGYLAPVLLSTGTGSHIGLFGYYGMLSLGILAVSLWQFWRPLNLLGFLFTAIIAALWGWSAYEPAFYASCQAFLIFNFLVFGVLTPLAGLRLDRRTMRFVDGTLVFGAPLVAFGFQYALMREQQWSMGAAFSALILGALYLPLARVLMRNWQNSGRRMAISFLALGCGFVTLAIPLALSARWTSMAWALEGVGVVWVGLLQRHRRMAWSGTALVVLAGASAVLAWLTGMDNVTMLVVFAILAGCCLIVGWRWSTERKWVEASVLAPIMLAGAVVSWLWWAFDGAWRLTAPNGISAALLGLAVAAVSACVWELLGKRLSWRALCHCGWLLWIVACGVLVYLVNVAGHPAAGGIQSIAWVLALAAAGFVLRRSATDVPQPVRWLPHATLTWLIIAVTVIEAIWRARDLPWGYEEWGVALVLCAQGLLILILVLMASHTWPVRSNRRAYLLYGAAPLLPLMVLGLAYGNLFSGHMFNWPYFPIINPLEESALFVLLMLWLWRNRAAGLQAHVSAPVTILLSILAAWWLNGALLRALAHYNGIVWEVRALWDSRLVQTVMALVWTLVALGCMFLARRRTSRGAWMTGAGILAVVIVKLFLVDSAGGGGLARAVSFLGVALLVLLIGYVAPLPPRRPVGSEGVV